MPNAASIMRPDCVLRDQFGVGCLVLCLPLGNARLQNDLDCHSQIEKSVFPGELPISSEPIAICPCLGKVKLLLCMSLSETGSATNACIRTVGSRSLWQAMKRATLHRRCTPARSPRRTSTRNSACYPSLHMSSSLQGAGGYVHLVGEITPYAAKLKHHGEYLLKFWPATKNSRAPAAVVPSAHDAGRGDERTQASACSIALRNPSAAEMICGQRDEIANPSRLAQPRRSATRQGSGFVALGGEYGWAGNKRQAAKYVPSHDSQIVPASARAPPRRAIGQEPGGLRNSRD